MLAIEVGNYPVRMPAAGPDEFFWLSIDFGVRESAVSLDDVITTFRDFGVVGFATWRPFQGFSVALVKDARGLVGFDGPRSELAQLAADRLGAEIASEWPDDDVLAVPRLARSRRPAAASERWVHVLPSTLGSLKVAPRFPMGQRPAELKVWELERRTLIVLPEHASINWSAEVRPVVGIAAFQHGVVLEVWTPAGHEAGRRDRWRSIAPDLRREWFITADFCNDDVSSERIREARLNNGRNTPSRFQTIVRAMTALGLPESASTRLAELSREPYFDGLESELVDLLALPVGVTAIAKGIAVPDAREIAVERGWSSAVRSRWAGASIAT